PDRALPDAARAARRGRRPRAVRERLRRGRGRAHPRGDRDAGGGRIDGHPAPRNGGRRLPGMTSVQELYELWAGDSELDTELQRSLEPRGTEWLFDVFAALGPRPGQLMADVGARDARHSIRLVREHGLRAVALDPLPQHVELARRA